MSYILEALRKAERERNLGQAPNLESIHTAPQTVRRRWMLWLLALALLTNAVILASIYHRSQDDSAIALPVATPAPKSGPVIAPRPQDPPLAAIDPPQAPDLPREKSVTVAAPVPALQTAPPELGMVTQHGQAESIPQASWDINADVMPPEPQASTVASQGMAELPPPMLKALPADFRRSLPSLNVDVHVFSDDPEKCFVLINSRAYREGDQIQEGPLIEGITAAGTVLSHQGQRFMIPVRR